MKCFPAFFLFLLLAPFIARGQWLQSNSGMPAGPDTGTSVYSFAELDSLLFAATSRGVFESQDHGYHWYAHHWSNNGYVVNGVQCEDIFVLPHSYTLNYPKWTWVRQVTKYITQGSISGQLSGNGIAIDPHGNAIIAATLQGSVYLDDTLLSAPNGALLIIKYDSTGKLLWIASASTPHGNVHYSGVACDSLGNIYAAGVLGPSTDGTTPSVDFGAQLSPGAVTAPFIVSYDSSGKFRWDNGASETSGSTVDNLSIQADSSGSAYLAGTFKGTLDVGVSTIISVRLQQKDLEDIFLAKFNPLVQWAVQTSSEGQIEKWQSRPPNQAHCIGLCTDAHGNSYLLGSSIDTEYIGGKPLPDSTSQFVAKFNTNGAAIWNVPFLVPDNEAFPFSSISCDRIGNLALCGGGTDQVTFNNKTYPGNNEASGILAALDSSGETRFVKFAPANVATPQVCVSGIGNIFVDIQSNDLHLTFDDSAVLEPTRPVDPKAPFTGITKLRNDGTVEWAFSDGFTGELAPSRDQSLFALYTPAVLQYYPDADAGRWGRLGWIGSMALAKLSAVPAGLTIDTDIYATGPSFGTRVSADMGHSWVVLKQSGSQFARIGTKIFLGNGFSTDFGETWMRDSGGGNYLHAIGSQLDAWDSPGVSFHSTDSGATWTQNSCRLALGMEATNGSRTFADGGGLSNDSGKTWIATTVGLGGSNGSYTSFNADSKALGVADNILFDSWLDLMASSNAGETWSPVSDNLPSGVLSLYQYGTELLVGLNNDGVYRRPISDIAANIHSTVPLFQWANQVHSYADASGEAIALDSSGNSVVFGSFQGSIAIGDQRYQHKFLAPGDRDYFLAKYDPNGNVLWSMRMAGGGIQDSTRPPTIAISSAGDIYLGAHFLNAFSAGMFNLKGNPWQPEAFLMKCNANGQVVWLDTVMTSLTNNSLGTIAIDRNGNVVVIGQAVSGTSVGGIRLPDSLDDQGSFIASYDPNGSARWATRILDGDEYSSTTALTVSSDNNYYVAGLWHDLRGVGGFLQEYDANGQLLDTSYFAVQSTADAITSLSSDGAGNIYALGTLADSLRLGTTTLKRGLVGDPRFFAQRSNGKWNWAEIIGWQSYIDFKQPIDGPPCRMATAQDGGTYIIGLDSVFGESSLEREQGINYVTKFDPMGTCEWTKQINNGYACVPMGIATDNSGSVWTTGSILNRDEVPGYPDGCCHMAFGLIGLATNTFDSNYERPFINRLSATTTPFAAVRNTALPGADNMVARLYPNPTTGFVKLQLNLDQAQIVRIMVCDPLGRELEQVFAGEAKDMEQQIDCSHLGNGSYFLSIQSSNGASTIPFVLQK